METIRTIKKVVNCQVLIDLPEAFEGKEVEIIVLPHQKNANSTRLSELLLTGPVWSDDDVQNFEATIKRGYMSRTSHLF